MRILVVEDDRAVADVLARGLREEGHSVECASSASQANAAIQVGHFDAIILDLILPDGDGLNLCRAWRAHGLTSGVLMLTARDAVPDRVAGLDSGADDYLVKPFSFEAGRNSRADSYPHIAGPTTTWSSPSASKSRWPG